MTVPLDQHEAAPGVPGRGETAQSHEIQMTAKRIEELSASEMQILATDVEEPCAGRAIMSSPQAIVDAQDHVMAVHRLLVVARVRTTDCSGAGFEPAAKRPYLREVRDGRENRSVADCTRAWARLVVTPAPIRVHAIGDLSSSLPRAVASG